MTDMIVRVKRIPEAGETLEGTSFQLGNGGKGANQAVMAASLGAEIELIACVGDDAFGGAALQNFVDWGIGTAAIRRVPGTSTGVAPILVDETGENRIVIVSGANGLMAAHEIDVAFAAMATPDVVLCQLEIPPACVKRALQRGRGAGAVTILNPAPFKSLESTTLRLADWIVPNELEFESLRRNVLGGDPADLREDVVALGAKLEVALAVTCGDRGALLYAPRDDALAQWVPARAATVVDTTGAGDAFAGAFAYALARNATPTRAAQFACACASSSVEREGTQSSYPREPELAALKSMLDQEA